MHTKQELLEAYNYIDLKSCTFGAGLKNFKWTPNETTAFLDCLANAVSSECREIIKSKSSQLTTQKIKAWFIFHNNFLQKNTDSRLRHCTMEQMKNKLKKKIFVQEHGVPSNILPLLRRKMLKGMQPLLNDYFLPSSSSLLMMMTIHVLYQEDLDT